MVTDTSDERTETFRRMEVARGGGYQPVNVSAVGTPPSSSVTEIVPDGIPIGQRPTKSCDHDFVFLRAEDFINPDGVQNLGKHRSFKDMFYCRRCLEYREVKR